MCDNEKEWKAFPEQFKDSTNENESKFFKYLTKKLIPLVLLDYKRAKVARQEREKQIEAQRLLEIQQAEEERLELIREEEERQLQVNYKLILASP